MAHVIVAYGPRGRLNDTSLAWASHDARRSDGELDDRYRELLFTVLQTSPLFGLAVVLFVGALALWGWSTYRLPMGANLATTTWDARYRAD